MAQSQNDTANVSVGKGVKGGYAWSAPIGTKVPTSIDEELAEQFENLGYISEDGIVFEIENDAEDFVDMNGETIESASSSFKESITLTLAERRPASMRVAFGADNVSEGEEFMTIKHNSNTKENRVFVFEFVLRNGRRQRTVVPKGQVTELGEMNYTSSELAGVEAIITAFPDENGNCVIDYIQNADKVRKAKVSVTTVKKN